jgi:flagellar basal-body rod protein FlgB
MTNSLTTDNATTAMKLALDGLSKRSDAIGRNLANVDTPGYKAQNMDFETAVKQALNNNQTNELQMTTTNAGHLAAAPDKTVGFQSVMRSGGSERADGNNVDVDVELTQLSETGIRYQALTQMISKKFNLIKTITASR